MLFYPDGAEIRIGDCIRHATAAAVVEVLVEGPIIASWGLDQAGSMIVCEQCGRLFVVADSLDAQDVQFVDRGPDTLFKQSDA